MEHGKAWAYTSQPWSQELLPNLAGMGIQQQLLLMKVMWSLPWEARQPASSIPLGALGSRPQDNPVGTESKPCIPEWAGFCPPAEVGAHQELWYRSYCSSEQAAPLSCLEKLGDWCQMPLLEMLRWLSWRSGSCWLPCRQGWLSPWEQKGLFPLELSNLTKIFLCCSLLTVTCSHSIRQQRCKRISFYKFLNTLQNYSITPPAR